MLPGSARVAARAAREKEELLWRITYILPERDRFRKATESLLYISGVSRFQSCADDCAKRFAQTDGRFPHFDPFIDVLYGDAQQVVMQLMESWSPFYSAGKSVIAVDII